VDAWLKCEYVAPRVGETFDGMVMGVTEFGLFVELQGFYVQGLLHISELGSDYFQYQPQSLALVGERSGRRFTLGDRLSVVLVDVVPEEGKLDLRLDPTKPAGSKGGKTGRKGSKESKDKQGKVSGRRGQASRDDRKGKGRRAKGRGKR
jgi:ribonuclease R